METKLFNSEEAATEAAKPGDHILRLHGGGYEVVSSRFELDRQYYHSGEGRKIFFTFIKTKPSEQEAEETNGGIPFGHHVEKVNEMEYDVVRDDNEDFEEDDDYYPGGPDNDGRYY